MDVNGTRFHGIVGQDDWCHCRLDGQPDAVADWCAPAVARANPDWLRVEWDARSGALTLRRRLPLFPRGRRDRPLEPAMRRGAARDRFGNWYWIARDRTAIVWLPSGGGAPATFWTSAAAPRPRRPGSFRSCVEATRTPAQLAGLCVTAHHYLVAGDLSDEAILVFDLHGGGGPTVLRFDSPFEPFDMAAAADGGFWILDRAHRSYLGLDRQFRLVTESGLATVAPGRPEPAFAPTRGERPEPVPRTSARAFPLAGDDPIAIESLPDGSVLILDTPVAGGSSVLLHYRLGSQLAPALPLPELSEVAGRAGERPLIGHDFAIARDDGRTTLYIVERDGNQAIAFDLDLEGSPPRLDPLREYLPMHSSGGRALVGGPGRPAYDVTGAGDDADLSTRWVEIRSLEQPRFTRDAVLETPIFDGRDHGCIWHRVFLDACIPPEAEVELAARAYDDRELLPLLPYVRQPALYRRGLGAEIPYFRPFGPVPAASDGKGTFELLFQNLAGRYLQIRLALRGNGRSSPRLSHLRAYYPRFSYPDRYLPEVYHQDAASHSFLERLLANFEGLLTQIEGQIVDARILFDPRSAPPEALDWLAAWLGLIVDPLWQDIQARRTGATDRVDPRLDRRRLLIRFARKLFERRGTSDGIRFALQLFLDPCLEGFLARLERAGTAPDPRLEEEFSAFGLPLPRLTDSDLERENLFYAYVIAAARRAPVRLVEQFLTRGGRAVAAGDPTFGDAAADGIAASAHRFSVLIPNDLPAEEEAMVGRIVELERPAHTSIRIGRYFGSFRVGEVRLGLDTVLGDGGRFEPQILGRTPLAQGYLRPGHPFDVHDRLVADRDRLGDLPPL